MSELDLGEFDIDENIRVLGKLTPVPDSPGHYTCLANFYGTLAVIEVKVTAKQTKAKIFA